MRQAYMGLHEHLTVRWEFGGGDNEVESGLHISDLLLYKVAGGIGHNNRKKM